jgi:hypothetical protein
MPPGSLIPKDVKKRLGVLEKFAPKEVLDQLKILSEAERSFVIPVRVVDNGKEKYLIIAGMLLSEKVPVSPSFDEIDIQLIDYALQKAKNALEQMKAKQNQTSETEGDEEGDSE